MSTCSLELVHTYDGVIFSTDSEGITLPPSAITWLFLSEVTMTRNLRIHKHVTKAATDELI